MADPGAAGAAAGAGAAAAPDPQDPFFMNKVPLFYGDPKQDAFSAETWVARVQEHKRIGDWNDARTMSHIQLALRGPALEWYTAASVRNIPNFFIWNTFKNLLLEIYSKTKTQRTTTAIFDGLKQQPHEKVSQFFARCARAIDDIKALRPPIAQPPNPWLADVLAIAAFAALPLATRQAQCTNLMQIGASAAEESIACQYFVAGLKNEIRERIFYMTPAGGFQQLYDACRVANEIERQLTDPKHLTIAVATEEEAKKEDYTAQEIAAFNRGTGFRRGRGGRGRGIRGRGTFKGTAPTSSGKFEGECFHCHKTGHMAKDCFKKKASMRGGYKKVSNVEHQGQEEYDEEEEEDEEEEVQPFIGSLHLKN
jgi:hypothetical protein